MMVWLWVIAACFLVGVLVLRWKLQPLLKALGVECNVEGVLTLKNLRLAKPDLCFKLALLQFRIKAFKLEVVLHGIELLLFWSLCEDLEPGIGDQSKTPTEKLKLLVKVLARLITFAKRERDTWPEPRKPNSRIIEPKQLDGGLESTSQSAAVFGKLALLAKFIAYKYVRFNIDGIEVAALQKNAMSQNRNSPFLQHMDKSASQWHMQPILSCRLRGIKPSVLHSSVDSSSHRSTATAASF